MIVFDLFDNWSKKYKKSIDCDNPKGFSQQAHCDGRRARQAGKTTKSKSINEAAYTLMDGFERLLPLAVKHLNLPSIPKIHLNKKQSGTHQASFGGYDSGTDEINLTINNRHPVDVLRTLAHELVHYKQKLDKKLDHDSWKTGSDAENEANAEAGVIMRLFNKQNPEFMGVPPILEHISKQDNKYVVYSKDRKRKFGTYTSREDAEKRLRQIEMFKHMNEMSHREAEKVLKKHHYHLERTHGGHEIWKDEEGHTFTLPHKHHAKDISKGVEHALKKEITHENAESSGYKEIEFICVNPEYPDATDPKLQKQMYLGLKKIPNVIPLLQDWDEYSEGQKSLSAIYKDKESRQKIFALAKQLGVEIDLERPVSDDYIDRAIRGEHEGQQGVTENFADGKKPGRKGLAKRMGVDCSKSKTELRAIAKRSTGEKQRMAHWCANMKGGKR